MGRPPRAGYRQDALEGGSVELVTSSAEGLAVLLSDGDVELSAFDEEELAAFTPGVDAEGRLVPLPRIDSLDGDERALALSRGLRSLLDRGFVSTAADPEAEPELLGDYGVIMSVRLAPAFVVIADSDQDGDERSRYLYGLGSAAVLEETPGADGTHRFMLRSTTSAARELVKVVDPLHRSTQDSELVTAEEELDAAVADAEVVTRLYAVRRREPGRLDEWEASVAVGEAGTWVIAGDETGLVGRELSRSSLRLLLHRLLEPLGI
jgi:hypothetical protein